MSDIGSFLQARLDEDEQLARIARWDPARVLAEVEAKRMIIEHWQRWQDTRVKVSTGWTDRTATAYRMAMDWTLHLMASAYSDHPDYDSV